MQRTLAEADFGAHVIASDEEALQAAAEFAALIEPGAAERDAQRQVPRAELEALGRSGLLGIKIPSEYGGAGVSFETLAEVFRIISSADGAIGQIPQNHFHFVGVIERDGTDAQKRFFFGEVLRGARLGNALSERGPKRFREREGRRFLDLGTRLTADPDGGYRISGRKYYSTGALTAQWIPVFANDEQDRLMMAYIERDAQGVQVLDDWDAMGQRATWSGTTVLDDVHVPEEHVVPHWHTYLRPTTFGAWGQLMHVAVDVGIAGNALEDAAEFVRTRSNPYFESGLERAAEEPHLILSFGKLATRLHAAEELLRKAARKLDEAELEPDDEDRVAAARLAVAEAKAFASDVAVQISSDLFELAGTSAASEAHNLNRHWRNARTHTLHDPARWKYFASGNFVLNGVRPAKEHPLL
jgi:SfnB family sulfur acquisition oxidoreductase